MAWFIKTEKFKQETKSLSFQEKDYFLQQHKDWIKLKRSLGIEIFSGYLINQNKLPGGGGLLILKSKSYQEARKIILKDPMIANNLVNWELHEVISVDKDLSELS